MLFLMLIGLYTSRVVLKTLGVDDYGTYNVVYSVIMMFTVISNSISTSIGRFLAFEIGAGDKEKLKKVFSSAIFIQAGLVILLFLLAETVGLWYLNEKIVIPEGRETAAFWVFQASAIMLAVQLFSIPFNSTIVAHEDMKAFAWISIIEGALKLAVALILIFTSWDKLIVYAILMMSVALTVRFIYAIYCKKHFEESSGALVFDKKTILPMLSLGAWSFTAHGVGVFNTQGVNLVSNAYFGVGINAIRGIAGQVENIVRQFVTNFLTALNPLIIKTWAEGNQDYCFALVRKGCKFCFLIVLLFVTPFIFESDFILHIWLGDVPEGAALFTCLAIICVMMDFMSNSLAQLMIANGKVGKYYIVTSAVSSLTFIGTIIAFHKGASPQTAYYISASILLVISVTRLIFTNRYCSFPVLPFLKEVVFPIILATSFSILTIWIFSLFFSINNNFMHCVRIIVSMISVCVLSYFIALTNGEKDYIKSSLHNILH